MKLSRLLFKQLNFKIVSGLFFTQSLMYRVISSRTTYGSKLNCRIFGDDILWTINPGGVESPIFQIFTSKFNLIGNFFSDFAVLNKNQVAFLIKISFLWKLVEILSSYRSNIFNEVKKQGIYQIDATKIWINVFPVSRPGKLPGVNRTFKNGREFHRV